GERGAGGRWRGGGGWGGKRARGRGKGGLYSGPWPPFAKKRKGGGGGRPTPRHNSARKAATQTSPLRSVRLKISVLAMCRARNGNNCPSDSPRNRSRCQNG